MTRNQVCQRKEH